MEEFFVLNKLPYSVLIWLHLGTDFILKNSFWLLIVPMIINAVFILSSRFSFGFGKSVASVIKKSSNVAISRDEVPDSYKFAYAYSRNPNLFSNIEQEDALRFFRTLDEKIDSLKSDDVESEDISSGDLSNEEEKLNNQMVFAKKDKLYARLLGGFNIIILTIIIASNVYGYVYYNSLFSENFNKTPVGYKIDMNKYVTIEDDVVREKVKRINRYVEMLNEIKLQSEKAKIEKELEAEQRYD